MTIAIAGIASLTVIAVAMILSAAAITSKTNKEQTKQSETQLITAEARALVASYIKERQKMEIEKKMPLKITDRDVLYLCDKSKCTDAHQCGECIHTTDVEHAANFRKEMWGSSCVYVEQSKDERVL